MRLLYTLGWYLALPGVFLRLLWRSRRNSGYRRGWVERLGRAPRIKGGPVWVHAVSVGETVAAAPLVRALLIKFPHIPVLITSTTPTGADRAAEIFGDAVKQSYLPFDLPFAVGRFLERTRPRLGVIMETELWPNLFHVCEKRNLPLILANARLSRPSARGYRRAGRLIRRSLNALHYVGAQGKADAARFRKLGVAAGRVEVTGNLKFETERREGLQARAKSLRAFIGPGPVWLAASTHGGEEPLVLRAFASARKSAPGLRLLLTPRHPERFEAVRRLCETAGLRVSRRSTGWGDSVGADVLLGDTMGELELFYATADFAFIGGSLVETGGHNLIEPAVNGCPMLLGPHTFNISSLRDTFERASALIAVADAAALGRAAARLAGDPEERRQLAGRAYALLEQHRGAREKLLRVIEGRLVDKPGSLTARRFDSSS